MKRYAFARQLTFGQTCCAVILVTVTALSGCAALQDGNESILSINLPQDRAKASRLTYAGIKSLEAGSIDLAAERFVLAIQADETYGPAHNNLGLLHYDQGNLYQAVLAFEQAMEFMPHDPTVLYNLGLTLEAAGRTDEAMDLYTQAVQMDPADPHFLGNLVRLRIRLGENDTILRTQLKDLILIETRPEWRGWADKQLAINFNDLLDRGPETPDFNSEMDSQRDEKSGPKKRVIDLSNRDTKPVPLTSQPQILSGPVIESTEVPYGSSPAIRSGSSSTDGLFDDLGPSVYDTEAAVPSDMDYFGSP